MSMSKSQSMMILLWLSILAKVPGPEESYLERADSSTVLWSQVTSTVLWVSGIRRDNPTSADWKKVPSCLSQRQSSRKEHELYISEVSHSSRQVLGRVTHAKWIFGPGFSLKHSSLPDPFQPPTSGPT